MDLERLRRVGRLVEPGSWAVTVGDLLPEAPPLLKGIVLGVSFIGGAPALESVSETVRRPASWWETLRGQLQDLLLTRPGPFTARVLVHALRSLSAPADLPELLQLEALANPTEPDLQRLAA